MSTVDSKAPAKASNVYLFKNGYGMIVKTFDFPSNVDNNKKGTVEIIDTPVNAVHGTFWVQSTSNEIVLKSVQTKKTQKFVEKECLTIEDLVEGNVGEEVYLQISNGSSTDKELVSGKIRSVKRRIEHSDDDEKNLLPEPSPIYDPYGRVVSSSNRNKSVQQGNLVFVETTNDGLLAIPLSNIQSIRGKTLKNSYQRKMFTNCLSIEYENQSNSNQTGFMKYLTFGLTWVPSYSLTLLSKNKSAEKILRLSSKAVILNDIENMSVNNLYCIVGFPNISKFASVIDPIVSEENVREFLDKLNNSESASLHRYSSSVMANSVMTQQMIAPISHRNNNTVPDFPSSDSDGDDLHLYEFHNVLLQKKERLILPIFEIDLNYKDVYHCEIDGTLFEDIYGRQTEKKDFEEVWHSVEFDNRSNFVWTTAPIVITKGLEEQQLIGQDKLTYTIKGSTALVNITKALDIRVKFDERVISTNPTRLTFHNQPYQTDNIEGKLVITNYKSEDAAVVINITLTGKLTNLNIPPKKDDIKTNRDAANERHKIQWELTVKSKQIVEIKYIRAFNKRV